MNTVKNIFYSRLASSQYVFKDGTTAIFVAGQYLTDDPKQITELMAEVSKNHPHIYTNPKALTVDTGLQEKIRAAQAEAVDKVMKENKAQLDAIAEDGIAVLKAAGVNPVPPANQAQQVLEQVARPDQQGTVVNTTNTSKAVVQANVAQNAAGVLVVPKLNVQNSTDVAAATAGQK